MIIKIHGIESVEELRKLCSIMKTMVEEKKLKIGEISSGGCEDNLKRPYLEVIFQGADEQVEPVKQALYEFNVFMEVQITQLD